MKIKENKKYEVPTFDVLFFTDDVLSRSNRPAFEFDGHEDDDNLGEDIFL